MAYDLPDLKPPRILKINRNNKTITYCPLTTDYLLEIDKRLNINSLMEAESILRKADAYVHGKLPDECSFIAAKLGLISLVR